MRVREGAPIMHSAGNHEKVEKNGVLLHSDLETLFNQTITIER